jgi:hypothetical protein
VHATVGIHANGESQGIGFLREFREMHPTGDNSLRPTIRTQRNAEENERAIVDPELEKLRNEHAAWRTRGTRIARIERMRLSFASTFFIESTTR